MKCLENRYIRAIGGAALLSAAATFVAPSARAELLDDDADPAAVDVHAFVSQGFLVTQNANWLARDSTKGSAQFSEAGINFTKSVTDRLRVGVQLFARILGPQGNYDTKMDWFYLDYRFKDWLGVRAGRVKIPFGLYNEINDADSARTAILLPQSVYPIQNRDYLLAQTGGEVYGRIRLDDAGAIEYRLYGGTIIFDTTGTSTPAVQIVDLHVPYLFGGRLMWETPIEGLRIGASVQALRLDTTLLTQNKTVDVKIPAKLWVASLEYSEHNFLFASEYSRWYVRADTSDPTLFPGSSEVVSERAYAMITYRIAPWLQPGAYYALLFPDVSNRSGRDHVQHDVAITFRYDIGPNWIVKLEQHFMQGTANLTPALNDNRSLATLPSSWGIFFVKTTAYF
jgi:hypothetical protein